MFVSSLIVTLIRITNDNLINVLMICPPFVSVWWASHKFCFWFWSTFLSNSYSISNPGLEASSFWGRKLHKITSFEERIYDTIFLIKIFEWTFQSMQKIFILNKFKMVKIKKIGGEVMKIYVSFVLFTNNSFICQILSLFPHLISWYQRYLSRI